jgi:Phospholipase_D-nuclease N-terminal
MARMAWSLAGKPPPAARPLCLADLQAGNTSEMEQCSCSRMMIALFTEGLPQAQNADRSSNTSTRSKRNRAMANIGYNGLWGLLILVGDVWAIINIFQSSASNEKKLLWTLVVLLLPLLGLILWFFLGPKAGRT